MQRSSVSNDERSVAIIGLSCRFPGQAKDLDGFWELLCRGISAHSTVPKDRFNIEAFYSGPGGGGLNTCRTDSGHFLSSDIRRWDANFFGVTADEAMAMDPQQRLMMEVAFEAFENAGMTPSQLDGSSTGVWMGVNSNDWRETLFRDPEAAPLHTWTGTGPEYISGRVSWFFNLRGPSMTVNTACSSSLVALHEARNAILAGDCEMAIVGGANLIFNPEYYMYYSNQLFLSPDGKCKSFDASGDGFGRGEGLGAVILKPLKRAVEHGDSIRAILRGSGVGQDGWTSGITLPNADAQADLIRAVYADAGLDPRTTGYVEAHGTGTKVGDPAELEAIAKAMKTAERAKQLMVGSVKTNIGHLEAAAGIAGLVKSILMLEKAQLPPTIGIKNFNPKIEWDQWKLQVNDVLLPWPKDSDQPRRIGISSFGASGTIAHAILDEGYKSTNGVHDPTAIWPSCTWPHHQLVTVSAADKDGIRRQAQALGKYLQQWLERKLPSSQEETAFLGQLAYTLGTKRADLSYRSFIVADNIRDLCAQLMPDDQSSSALTSAITRAAAGNTSDGPHLRIGMVFTGQGAQWARMGIELLRYKVFEQSLQRADDFFRDRLGCAWSALQELRADKDRCNLKKAEYSQPLCTALQIALVDLLASWGIRPAAVAGHSSGEMAAAYAIGSLSAEDALTAAYWRGNLDGRTSQPRGAMVAAALSEQAAQALIGQVPRSKGVVVVGCVNSPSSVTLSGDEEAVMAVAQLITDQGVFNRRLQVDAAYHSPHQSRVSEEYLMRILHMAPKPIRPGCTMFSTVTGRVVPNERALGPTNWVRNLVSPVLFAQAVEAMLVSKEANVQLLLEVGPHGALAAPCQNIMSKAGVTLPYCSVLSRDKDAAVTSLATAGELWARGAKINVAAVNLPDLDSIPPAPLIDLPPYQWNHERSYWSESRLATEYCHRRHPHARFLGTPFPTLVEGEHLWRALIRPSDEDWLLDHKIQGTVVYPAVGYIAMTVEAARQMATTTSQNGSGGGSSRSLRAFHLREIEFLAATAPAEHQAIEITICVRPAPGSSATSPDWHHYTISTCTDGKTIRNVCTGLFQVEYEPEAETAEAYELAEADGRIRARLLQAKAECRQQKNPEGFYMELARIGLEFGPAFRNMSAIWTGKSQSYCVVDVVNPSSKCDSEERPFIIHPATFDPILQTITAALDSPSRTPVPTAIEELVISADIPREVGRRLHVCSNVVPRGNYDILSEIHALEEESNRPVMLLRGLKTTLLPPSDVVGALEKAHKICGRIEWRPSLELLLSRPDDLRNVILNRINGEREALNELMQIICHNFPEASILEIGVSPDDEFLAQKLSLSWSRVLDWETAAWTGDGIQYSSTTGETNSSDSQVDVVILRQLPPNQDFGALLTEITDKLNKESPLGFVCITSSIEVVEKALAERNTKPLLSIHDKHAERGILVFRATGKESEPVLCKSRRGSVVVLRSNQPSSLEASMSRHLQKHLQQIGINTTVSQWEDVSTVPANAHVISLVEVSKAVVETLDEADFAKLKNLVSKTSEVLWVTSETCQGIAIRGAVDGFSRSLKNEDARVVFRVAHFGRRVEADAEKMAGVIVRLVTNKTRDDEFRVKVLGDDLVAFTCRVAPDEMLSNYVQKKAGTISEGRVLPDESSQQISSKDRPIIKLDIAERGQLETLHFVEHQSFGSELKDDEIEIQVEASGLNFKDIMIALGRVPGTMEGAEGSGIITRVGRTVAGFRVHDRVVCLSIGMHSSLIRVPSWVCRKIPDSLSFAEAASLPVVHCTAYNAFVRIARADESEAPDVRKSVLIHAAAGGLGQVAIQYAQHFGMEIFATVGSQAKRDLIKRLYGIPDDHILCSRDTSFAMAINRMTAHRGVDMVLNSLAGEILRQSWQCLAPGGTFVEVGKAAIDSVRPPGNEVGATYTVFDLEHIIRRNPRLASRLLDGALEYVRSGVIKPPSPCRLVSISDLHEAFRLMQTGQHMGKIVFSWSGNPVVPMLKPNPFSIVASMPSQLDPDATYLLVGGLGGIGRSISRMLVDMGARKLCFISRSGLSSSPPARALVAELQALQCRVTAYACDAADASQLSQTLVNCQRDSGPVRGLVQCAMVLRDCTFANMEFSQWNDAVRPKIQASWNLHNILPDLDFFTMLASFAGYFGNAGQSNYGAGCAFQDSLAEYRRSIGKPAVSLDLGIVNDVGILAETGLTDNLRDWAPQFGIKERQLQDLIRISLLDQLTARPAIPPQVPTGFASLRAADLAAIPRPVYLNDSRFSVLAADGRLESQMSNGQRSGHASSFQHRLEAAKVTREKAEVRAIVEEMLTHKVAQSLKVAADEIDPNKSLPSYGINSLVAIEIRNWIFKEIKANVAIFNLIAPVPLTKLVEDITNELG
ncbi:hypothetical protein PpBr36_06863 [Pyricularia pennisetigena]|uniref:hypothetical protein n=1 Tax=Pyricularia pennisetigena TaxID=1578925 RepID=UPI00114FB0ED|nr:hypothetical protein PpBr36_06863 [Pyricularia pennisetigena]TLS24973.1 hypothetical protein PpBr36_06863 [Pyricularia pennisetigena]